MPRKPLIYTHELPYHIVARSNNREWFRGDLEQIWIIFCEEISKLNQEYMFSPHAFTLMTNHYHMIASCHEQHNLGYVMRLLQNRTSVRINSLSGRINHCYGSKYKASLITHEKYYMIAMRYLHRNPVEVNLCKKVEDWSYTSSSILYQNPNAQLPISSHIFESTFNYVQQRPGVLSWFNENYKAGEHDKLQKAVKRTIFKLRKTNPYKLIFP